MAKGVPGMQKYTKKIGWQKYEDFLEKQFSSPLLNTIMQNIAMQNLILEDDDQDGDMDDEGDAEIKDTSHLNMMLPVTRQLIEDVTMLSNFDCWIAHTNFDITPKIKDRLNSIPGIELLKICSRYRFFIGIGQMFDFKEVRNKIEESLIKGD
jgi:hypothetical protein